MKDFWITLVFILIVMVAIIFTLQKCKTAPVTKENDKVMREQFAMMDRQLWYEHLQGARNKVEEDEFDYAPASAVFYDKNEQTGLCYAFWGNSFHQAPSWACDKK